jgi:glycosyltransferase involved in cell wall biosynthesis
MKIILFDINRLSFEGGAEKYLEGVGISFAKKGHQVYFVGDCRAILKFYVLLGILLLVNPPWKFLSLLFDLKKSPPMNSGVEKFIKHIPLHLRSLLPFSSERKKVRKLLEESDGIFVKNEITELIFFWLLRIKNPNSSIIIFSSLRYPEIKTLRAKLHNLIYSSKIYLALVKKFGSIVVSNREDQRIFKEKFGFDERKIFYIPYGLKKEYFVKEEEFLKSSKFTVLFAGRMEEQKGIYDLKKIIEAINKTEKADFFFSIAGSGPLEAIPRELGKRFANVEYKGQLAPKELRKLYLSSDLLFVPSKWETFSYVCLEAQACGVPVVAFDIPGPRDIIIDGITGVLVPPGDVSKFPKAIWYYYLLKNKDSREYLKLKRGISKKTAARFSLEKTVRDLGKICLS